MRDLSRICPENPGALSHAPGVPLVEAVLPKGLELTAYGVRSFVASTSSSSLGLMLGFSVISQPEKSTFLMLEKNKEEHEMKNQSCQIWNPWNVLAGVLFILGISATQAVMADENGTFTNASLQGRYAYTNSVSGVASLGLITFDGEGGLSANIKVNLPCPEAQEPGCPRIITDLGEVDGEYTVAPDGSGVATINFADPTGPTTYDLMISGTSKQGDKLLATQVFTASQNGGLDGQLVAPTWSRIGD